MEFLVLQLKEAVGSRESGARVGPAWDPRGLECQNQLVYYAYVLPGVTVGFPSGIIR